MSIDPKKCCGTHSKEKEDNGECCQTQNEETVKQQDECYPGQADET